MNEQYIYMNKEENRALINSTTLSGDLSITRFPVNFKPLIVKGTLWNKFCNLFSDLKMVKIDMDETFTKDYFEQNRFCYSWLFHVDSGKVYRVWDGHLSNPANCSKLLKEGDVMIKGAGLFKCEDFKVFNF